MCLHHVFHCHSPPGVPATPSAFTEVCMEQLVHGDSHLVFVEFATNDGFQLTNDLRKRSYERLLRKVS